jgi:hypothetical protein
MIDRCKCVAKIMQNKKMRWKRHAVLLVEMRNAYDIVVGKSEGKRTLSRPRHRWEDRIKWIFKERGIRMLTGFISFKIETKGKLLCIQ